MLCLHFLKTLFGLALWIKSEFIFIYDFFLNWVLSCLFVPYFFIIISIYLNNCFFLYIINKERYITPIFLNVLKSIGQIYVLRVSSIFRVRSHKRNPAPDRIDSFLCKMYFWQNIYSCAFCAISIPRMPHPHTLFPWNPLQHIWLIEVWCVARRFLNTSGFPL